MKTFLFVPSTGDFQLTADDQQREEETSGPDIHISLSQAEAVAEPWQLDRCIKDRWGSRYRSQSHCGIKGGKPLVSYRYVMMEKQEWDFRLTSDLWPRWWWERLQSCLLGVDMRVTGTSQQEPWSLRDAFILHEGCIFIRNYEGWLFMEQYYRFHWTTSRSHGLLGVVWIV